MNNQKLMANQFKISRRSKDANLLAHKKGLRVMFG